ncbi:OmpW family outer membrane protein [Zhongshania arctica]|uniref:OmpW family outer membrane protein n=1 Tax=Zhongshania arctica TaxID=3238302 RepID=A0ABV3U042_9GAMM|tara:strand:+ start:1082 stop:1738 length:657 start_codon:yes stop_codon:yes gene_type:complete
MKKSGVTIAVLASLVASQHVVAFEKGDLIARVGIANVSPDESTSNVFVGGADQGASLEIGDDTQLGLNFAYFITDRINVEVLAATPFSHDVSFSNGARLGEVTHLPPTVSVNYYLNSPSSAFQPYAGIGLNYTFIYDEEFSSENEAAGLSDLSLDNSFGLAAQIGADYILDEKWFINGAVRWIDIDTEATFSAGADRGSVSTIEIDPVVYMVSVGYKF